MTMIERFLSTKHAHLDNKSSSKPHKNTTQRFQTLLFDNLGRTVGAPNNLISRLVISNLTYLASSYFGLQDHASDRKQLVQSYVKLS